MIERTLQVRGGQVTYNADEVLECEECGRRGLRKLDIGGDVCPGCGEETERPVVVEEIHEYPKWVWNGAESIEEMAIRLEHKAAVLRALADDGWELREKVVDGHAFLEKTSKSTEAPTA